MKLKKLFWGLFFILAAALILVSQLGYLPGVTLLNLVLTILFIAIIIQSIFHINFAGILFPIAGIGILYAEPLGITQLTPWPILAVALFLSIGLTILFHPHRHYCNHDYENFATIINEEDSDTIQVKVNFSSSIKYVNTQDFKKGIFRCSFGALKVYFDNAKVNKNGADIILDASFGGVELYIPKNWNVINKINTTLGGVEEKNRNETGEGPTVTLRGNVSLAGVEIIYI